MSVIKKRVDNINGYLLNSASINITQEKTSLFGLPPMAKGCELGDGLFLTLKEHEKENLLNVSPESNIFIRKFLSAEDFLLGKTRYCLKFNEDNVKEALEIPLLVAAIENVRNFRLNSNSTTINKIAHKPHLFKNVKPYKEKVGLCIPVVSSKDRRYLPIGFCDKDTVPSNKLFVMYDWDYCIFALLASRLQMLWCGVVSCRLGEGSLSYSSTLAYNNFPVPKLNDEEKDLLSYYSRLILETREKIGGTLSELYNPKEMPSSLLKIHKELDNYLDKLYMKESCVLSLASDDDRLAMLFTMYQIKKSQ